MHIMSDLNYYEVCNLIRQGFSCFGDNFVCTLSHCKSSKQYCIYDKYGAEFKFLGFCCSLDEALRVIRYLRKRGHEVNYLISRDCVLLGAPRTGQLSLNL